MARAKQEASFESKLEKLEHLVNQLEDGDLSLDQSLSTFENGVKLLQECQKMLSEAEQKVQLLLEKQGAPVTEPLDSADE